MLWLRKKQQQKISKIKLPQDVLDLNIIVFVVVIADSCDQNFVCVYEGIFFILSSSLLQCVKNKEENKGKQNKKFFFCQIWWRPNGFRFKIQISYHCLVLLYYSYIVWDVSKLSILYIVWCFGVEPRPKWMNMNVFIFLCCSIYGRNIYDDEN